MSHAQRQHRASLGSLDSRDSSDSDLYSYVDNIVKECPVFRILLVGKSGSGKSTLVSEVFDVDEDEAGVQGYRTAEHDINREITYPSQKSLCLHDSKGLESGSIANLKIITDFIEDRKGGPFSEQLHAIWYCIEIPIAGQRPFEGGDIALLESLKESGNKVPVIIVFTKLDRLEYREQRRLKAEYVEAGMDKKEAAVKARTDSIAEGVKAYERTCVSVLRSSLVPSAWTAHCAVSNKHEKTILELIKLTTSTLTSSEGLGVVWASVQMTDVDLKVETSVLAGLYWRGLGAAMIPFQGVRRVTLLNILAHIHRDIVRIWNVNDPQGILMGSNMRTMIRKLFIEPIMAPTLSARSPHRDVEGTRIIENLASAVMDPSSSAMGPTAAVAKEVLESVAVGTPATARVLMAYIADLTLRARKPVLDGETEERQGHFPSRRHRRLHNIPGIDGARTRPHPDPRLYRRRRCHAIFQP
ncbi:hypothetical protein PsYK624_080170 [Phanerochaete sordida]|uniref:G domain-containing protein n=1 Tax=Phanerochaete sordida TaxID=48140 RepID=A0A9P3GBK2_9APHY|nr:hypothetical protein PsYK624_080170 [Phanerochaete sordida]